VQAIRKNLAISRDLKSDKTTFKHHLKMNNRDLIFSALMGSGSFKTIERLNLVQNDLSVKGLPPIPFLGNNQQVDSIPENQQYFPLSFSFSNSGQKWTFPFEPMISINGGNDVKSVNVSKHGIDKKGHQLAGSIKTHIRRKDFDITITGTLMGKQFRGSAVDCFPIKQMTDLFEYLIYAGSIYVYSHPLEILGINKIVIESYSFPFTKGENVQAYEIKALSDYPHSLIINEPF
jgi:hypothetical protein